MADTNEEHLTSLWTAYNLTLAAVGKSVASKTSGGFEKAYGRAAEKLMLAGQMYKSKLSIEESNDYDPASYN